MGCVGLDDVEESKRQDTEVSYRSGLASKKWRQRRSSGVKTWLSWSGDGVTEANGRMQMWSDCEEKDWRFENLTESTRNLSFYKNTSHRRSKAWISILRRMRERWEATSEAWQPWLRHVAFFYEPCPAESFQYQWTKWPCPFQSAQSSRTEIENPETRVYAA